MSDISVNERTENAYGFLWEREKGFAPVYWHFNMMQEVVPEQIVREGRGIDIGAGCGYDTYIMAKDNPTVNIVSTDISDGVYRIKKLTSDLGNVKIIKSSVLNIPLKDNIFDFAYSFGVLHHIVDPQKGLLEINRILKKDAPAFLYLYEDHSQNLAKFFALKAISIMRNITVLLPSRLIYALSWFFSPFVFVIFTLPARMLGRLKISGSLINRIPFNFGSGPFSLRGDLYDRFSAPIEYRFNRQQIYSMFTESGFSRINITRLNGIAGWVVWGHKTDA